ncbi:unnamed protein product [Brassica rapa subsp. trilocularis]
MDSPEAEEDRIPCFRDFVQVSGSLLSINKYSHVC